MARCHRLWKTAAAAAWVLCVSLAGCTSLHDYVHNGFKVGPNCGTPVAPLANCWIDSPQFRVAPNPELVAHWWTVFHDPKLDQLIACAFRQNLTLKEAYYRVIQARAQKAIAIGEMFPQQQYAEGSYNREAVAVPPNSAPSQRFFDQWNYGFALSWQLDLWGQLRRAVASADDNLNASVWNYDFVLVTLLSEVATNYVTIRTDQERIRLLQASAKLQRDVLKFVSDRFNAGYKQTELDLDQAVANLRQTEAGIPPLEIAVRQAEDALCILMGMPPVDLASLLGDAPIPTCGPDVVVGVPADLVRRRPDVRQAEYLAAAQGEQIGIAQAALYPMFSIDGSFGYSALNFKDLFRPTAFNGDRRAVVPVEPAELRANHQQCPAARRHLPAVSRDLPADRAPGRTTGGGRAGDVPAVAAADETLGRKRRGRRQGGQDLHLPVPGGPNEFQYLCHDRLGPGYPGGPGRAGAGADCPRIDFGVSCVGRRVGDRLRQRRHGHALGHAPVAGRAGQCANGAGQHADRSVRSAPGALSPPEPIPVPVPPGH